MHWIYWCLWRREREGGREGERERETEREKARERERLLQYTLYETGCTGSIGVCGGEKERERERKRARERERENERERERGRRERERERERDTLALLVLVEKTHCNTTAIFSTAGQHLIHPVKKRAIRSEDSNITAPCKCHCPFFPAAAAVEHVEGATRKI
jgi:hypothetical protein